MRFLVLIIWFCLTGFQSRAQFFSFSAYHQVPVEANGIPMENPWSGSYNSGQFWPCDMNNDGEDDMLVFDKTSNRVLVFLSVSVGGDRKWQYAPDYEDLIPALESWMATADFNCDGRQDLFTQTSAGIKVFRNVAVGPNQTGFVLEVDGLQSIGFSGVINVQVNSYGAPAITDVDGDGDLDVLAFDFTGNTVEFHRNRRMQNTGSCSGFDLKKDTCVFGLFATKPACGQIRLNTGCYGQRPGGGNENDLPSTKRVAHIGSQLAATDLDGDGDKDLLVGDLGCPLLNRLINGGTPENAVITAADTLFPSVGQYIKLPLFPSAYFMDVNFDGKKDMLVTPTSFSNVGDANAINTRAATLLYTNESSGPIPDFVLAEKDFLQNQSIELGEESIPVFADLDADGDQDLIVGHRGLKLGNLLLASLYLYRNTGTPTQPQFSLETTDYMGLSSLSRKRIRPIFTDINEDGATDLCWLSSPGGNSDSTKLGFLLNQNQPGQPFAFSGVNSAAQLNFMFAGYDCPVFTDISGDGKKDMLIGKNAGRIHYWQQVTGWPNLQYQLANNNYGNVSRAPYSANVNLAIADLDFNGTPDLATGDQTGALKLYRSLTQSSTATFAADSITYYNTVQNQKNYRLWGPFVSPAFADLNGDQYPEMAIGTTGGGVFLMLNRLGPNAVQSETSGQELNIWPNPMHGADIINWKGLQPEKIKLLNSQGKEVEAWQVNGLDSTGRLPLNRFAPGLYFLQFSTSHHTITKMVLINR